MHRGPTLLCSCRSFLAHCLPVQDGCLRSCHGVYIPDSTMEEGRLGKNVRERPGCLSIHSAAFSSKTFAYISSARIQSHSCTFTAYFLSCPNGRRGRGVVLLLLYLPGQHMASDDFAIHFYFQAVPTTEEINRAMLSGTPADSWLPPTESPHSWTGCSPLFCMPHGTYSK